jgi:Fanconi anemia group M protein
MTVDEIASEMEPNGITPQVVKAALAMLMRSELVAEVKRGRYAPAAAAKHKPSGSYEIRIEKIYPNSAVVVVNEEWRARLEPQDYNGPRNLIKKNSRFKAIAELYKVNGTLHIRIKDVIQKL